VSLRLSSSPTRGGNQTPRDYADLQPWWREVSLSRMFAAEVINMNDTSQIAQVSSKEQAELQRQTQAVIDEACRAIEAAIRRVWKS
jgi:hypothetical protein